MSGARQADAHLIYQMRQLDIYVRLTTHSVNFLCVMGKIQGVNDAVTQLNGNAGCKYIAISLHSHPLRGQVLL
jgi:hypothetical protein